MSIKSKILVILQLSFFLFFLIQGTFAKSWLLLVQFFAVVIAVWGILVMKLGNINIQPELKKHSIFIKTGPYKILRNPMYTGILLFFGSAVLSDFSILKLVALISLTIVLLMKVFMEEGFLKERFGNEYEEYKMKTYRLVPYVY